MKANNVVITAIICLALIECMALLKGIDGTLMIIICSAVAGLAGWRIPNARR